MPKQGLFESDKDFELRATKENLQSSTGLKQGWLESDDEYISRASKEALHKVSGTSQGWLESDSAYTARALGQATNLRQGLFESENEFIQRASLAQIEKATGLKQGGFESDENFRRRALSAGPKSSSSAPTVYSSSGNASSSQAHDTGSLFAPEFISGGTTGSGTGIGEFIFFILFSIVVGVLGGITLYSWLLERNFEGYLIIGSAVLGGIFALLKGKGLSADFSKTFLFAAGIPWIYTAFVALTAKGFGFSWVFVNLLFGIIRSSYYAVGPSFICALLVALLQKIFFSNKK